MKKNHKEKALHKYQSKKDKVIKEYEQRGYTVVPVSKEESKKIEEAKKKVRPSAKRSFKGKR